MALEARPAEVVKVLDDVARLGPYFEIATGVGAAWRPFPEVDGGRLLAVAEEYRERLGTDELRVAASILFQGLASRVWSPVVAAAGRGVVPDLSGLRWRWAPGEALALGLGEPRGWRVEDAAEAAGLIHPMVVDGQLRPLSEAILSFAGLADGLLWGNAASALAGSLNVGPAGSRGAIVRDLLAREPLAGAGSIGRDGFVRHNCCLYYRVPGGGMCGDCGLRDDRPGI
ncbi:(2Fe-2S)-binding protein [Spirillospora sp. NPDC048819]|uniref:(2Fe-2S)-binding protein n=1 Tax=Spirillospora sp. NPDC048819 TaxID=3155268 RepID=UPI00340A2557